MGEAVTAKTFAALGVSAVVGIGCGGAAWVFLSLLGAATRFRVAHEAVVFALPVAGFLLGAFFERHEESLRGGTDRVLRTARAGGEWLPPRMGPIVLLGTVLTHLFGGSAGREGTALQVGGSLADSVARRMRVASSSRPHVVRAGIAGGFAAVFGTPFAAVIFALEAPGLPAAPMVACAHAIVAAAAGEATARAFGVTHTRFPAVTSPSLSSALVLRLAALAVAFALVGAIFLALMRSTRTIAERTFPRLRHRMAAGGVALVVAWQLVGSGDLLGLSIPLAERAFVDATLPPSTFALKLGFTIATLASGFVGGEVTPLFVAGASLGNFAARRLGMPIELGAGIGFAALFGAVAHAPLALAVMATEMLGPGVLLPAAFVGLLASRLLGARALYPSQRR